MKKMWIKLFSIAIVFAMVLSLLACADNDETENASSSNFESVSATENDSSETGDIETFIETVVSTESEISTEGETSTESESSTESETSTKEETSSETEIMTEETVETTEKEKETTVEKIYGYDFKDSTWSSSFDMGGGATREIAIDPAGSGEAALALTHNSSQSASWIRNKNSFENTSTGKFTISVDLYIPSDALASAEDYVQMQINGAYDHHVNLRSDLASQNTPFDTKDFPRDKWFTVRFSFDMEKLRYDVEVIEDGLVRTAVFSGRSASSLKDTGPMNLRVFLGGENQTVYVDHMGLVTLGSGEVAEIEKIEKGVSFLRIDGVNAAGEILSVYGDFAGGANADELSELTWERCDSYSGEYIAVAYANGLTYTPEEGGYYLRVSAKYGAKTLISYPVYIRDEITEGFANGYLSASGNTLTAAVIYNNELPNFNATLKVVIYDGDTEVDTFTESFEAKQGSDVVIYKFEGVDLSGKRAVLSLLTDGRFSCGDVSLSEDLPAIKVQKTSEGTSVLVGKEKIAYFKQNRYMRFRPTVENDHWIGTDHNPIDMGFAYQESTVAGLYNTSVDFISAPGVFKIVFKGEKIGLKTTQQNELIGFYNPDKQEFSFIYNASITADSESWHKNSTWAPSNRIEAFDYCFERMSILDRVYNNNQNGDLYDYVIYENGDELVRIPKLPVPRTMLGGKYFYGFFLSPGESMYFPDAKEGGWQSTLLSAVGDTYIEICWSWYDIHNCAENSVPRLGRCDKFTVSQSWLYTTTTAEEDVELIDNAVEVEWRDLPNYQLPLFSTNNTFETQFGGTDWQYAWWKSSYDCTMDPNVGHDCAGSVKIQKTTAGEASWYTEGVWGFPYSFDQVQGKTYKVTGYIKTENVVGEAYISNIQYQHATPNDNTVIKSESVTGTNGWTRVSFTFVAQERELANGTTQRCIDHFFLTLNGTGTVWFDDVTIEEVE